MLCTCCARDNLPDERQDLGSGCVSGSSCSHQGCGHAAADETIPICEFIDDESAFLSDVLPSERIRFTNKKGKKIAKKAKEQSLRDSHLQSLVVGLGNTTSPEPPR
eukprot:2379149-Amphidinium_carterae.1